jgi:hypothetical protein
MVAGIRHLTGDSPGHAFFWCLFSGRGVSLVRNDVVRAKRCAAVYRLSRYYFFDDHTLTLARQREQTLNFTPAFRDKVGLGLLNKGIFNEWFRAGRAAVQSFHKIDLPLRPGGVH